MKQSLNRKFIIGLVIVIALSALTALLAANILYMLHSKPKMDQALVDTAETFVAGLEKADMTEAAIDEHLELFTALGYQGAMIKREDVMGKGQKRSISTVLPSHRQVSHSTGRNSLWQSSGMSWMVVCTRVKRQHSPIGS
ncbi:hypothetical protein [Salinicoccus sp. CNSTN-B1]